MKWLNALRKAKKVTVTPDQLGRTPLHYLHIGKNAGTQMAFIADQINDLQCSIVIQRHKHQVRFHNLPDDAQYFFAIRQPVSRFYSGFYSRKRCGQPRIYLPWSTDEARAFANFPHANFLAETLYSKGATGRAARHAIRSIPHCRAMQKKWFARDPDFLVRRPPVEIIRQEHFTQDLDRFLGHYGLQGRVRISNDPVTAHKNDYSEAPALSPLAISNLNRWYAEDQAFHDTCVSWIERRLD